MKINVLVILMLFFSAMLLAASPAPAQEEFNLGEIFVTGTREPLKLSEVPASTTVITSRDIRAIKPKDISELLLNVTDSVVNNYGSMGSLSTISIRGSSDKQVLILIDGRPVNTPNLGSADLSEIPVEMIERIEVVRGPFSSIYGSYAMDGVVNIITKKARKGSKVNLQVMGGSFSTYKEQASFSLGDEKSGVIFIPEFTSTSGSRENSGYYSSNYFLKYNQNMGKTDLDLTLQSATSRLGTPGVQPALDYEKRNTTQKILGNGTITSPFDYQTTSTFGLNSRVTWGKLDLQYYLNTWRPVNHSLYVVSGDFQTEDDDAQSQSSGLAANYRLDFGKNALTVGGNLENDTFAYTSNVSTEGKKSTSTSYSAQRTVGSLYIDCLLKTDPFIFSIGARYDSPSDFASQVSPKVSMLYNIGKELSLKSSYGTAYRAPTLNEIYWPSSVYARGNPNLLPEKNGSFEAGLEKIWGKTVLFKITYFNETMRDMIVWSPTGPVGPVGNIWQPDNISDVKKYGYEAELKLRPAKSLSLGVNYSRIYATQNNLEVSDYLTNQLLRRERKATNIPDYVTGVTFDWKMGEGWNFNARGRMIGERVQYYSHYANFPDSSVSMDTKRLKPCSLVDLALTKEVKIGGEKGEIFLKVDNLFNEQYANRFGATVSDRDYPMPGTAVYIGGRVQF